MSFCFRCIFLHLYIFSSCFCLLLNTMSLIMIKDSESNTFSYLLIYNIFAFQFFYLFLLSLSLYCLLQHISLFPFYSASRIFLWGIFFFVLRFTLSFRHFAISIHPSLPTSSRFPLLFFMDSYASFIALSTLHPCTSLF